MIGIQLFFRNDIHSQFRNCICMRLRVNLLMCSMDVIKADIHHDDNDVLVVSTVGNV